VTGGGRIDETALEYLQMLLSLRLRCPVCHQTFPASFLRHLHELIGSPTLHILLFPKPMPLLVLLTIT
jgi:hypothetical protein